MSSTEEVRQKYERITKLYEDYDGCTRCGLCRPEGRHRMSVPFGDGHPDASIMLIGEAAGEREDYEASPFVGASGKLLDLYLDIIVNGYVRKPDDETSPDPRDEIFITNVVLCRPSKVDKGRVVNRAPTKEEIAACRDRLHQTIEIVDPHVVVVLGSVAFRALAKGGNKGITSVARDPRIQRLEITTAGQVLPEVIRTGFGTWHPSALLRDKDMSVNSPRHQTYRTLCRAFETADQADSIFYDRAPKARHTNSYADLVRAMKRLR